MKSVLLLLAAALCAMGAAQTPSPLVRVGTIAVPGMTGTWDHIGADGATARLFGNAQDVQALEVFDLKAGIFDRAITGPFNRNQGICMAQGKLVISNGRSGLCTFFDGKTLESGKAVGIGLGADLMAYDAKSGLLYVDHGGRDSNRGFGAVAVIDVGKEQLVADIATDLRPAAMALDASTGRLLVCIPSADQVVVVDTATRAIARRFGLGSAHKPVSIALDGETRRLYVLTRTPAHLLVLDADSGKLLQELDGVGEAEDLWVDSIHHRLYATGLEGAIFVYSTTGSCSLTAKIPTRAHAGTSVWVPELNRFYVGVAQHESELPELWVYEAAP